MYLFLAVTDNEWFRFLRDRAPLEEGGQHRLDNGLLLRSDIRRLFDAGYVTVTPDSRFRVSRKPEVALVLQRYSGSDPTSRPRLRNVPL